MHCWGMRIKKKKFIFSRTQKKKIIIIILCIYFFFSLWKTGGDSRSPTIVIAFLMKFKGMTLKDALEHVRKIKPTIEPNEGFAKQLISYEKSLFGKNSMEITDFEFNED